MSIPFGKITTITANPDGTQEIIDQSYHEGKLRSERRSFSESVYVLDKSQALTEVMKALELVATKQTSRLTVDVEADKKTGLFKRVVKTYEISD